MKKGKQNQRVEREWKTSSILLESRGPTFPLRLVLNSDSVSPNTNADDSKCHFSGFIAVRRLLRVSSQKRRRRVAQSWFTEVRSRLSGGPLMSSSDTNKICCCELPTPTNARLQLRDSFLPGAESVTMPRQQQQSWRLKPKINIWRKNAMKQQKEIKLPIIPSPDSLTCSRLSPDDVSASSIKMSWKNFMVLGFKRPSSDWRRQEGKWRRTKKPSSKGTNRWGTRLEPGRGHNDKLLFSRRHGSAAQTWLTIKGHRIEMSDTSQ